MRQLVCLFFQGRVGFRNRILGGLRAIVQFSYLGFVGISSIAGWRGRIES